MHDQSRTPFDDLPSPQQAGILCNDPQFQRFAGLRGLGVNEDLNPTAAAEYLRTTCRIASRRDLASDASAAQRFQTLRSEFDAWRGRIARPRA